MLARFPALSYQPATRGAPRVVAIAKRAGDFGTLLTAVEAAGLTALLEGKGPFTLFAPTDAAFKKLPEGALQELLADKAKLTAILRYHVVPGRVAAADILSSQTLKTASSSPRLAPSRHGLGTVRRATTSPTPGSAR